MVPVHLRTSTAGTPIKVGMSPVQIAFTPDGKMAYVANYASEQCHPDPARRRPGRPGDPRREDRDPAGGQPGRHDGIPSRFEHIRRAALRAGPGHSDPRRDELCREADKGWPVADCHRDRPLNRVCKASSETTQKPPKPCPGDDSRCHRSPARRMCLGCASDAWRLAWRLSAPPSNV